MTNLSSSSGLPQSLEEEAARVSLRNVAITSQAQNAAQIERATSSSSGARPRSPENLESTAGEFVEPTTGGVQRAACLAAKAAASDKQEKKARHRRRRGLGAYVRRASSDLGDSPAGGYDPLLLFPLSPVATASSYGSRNGRSNGSQGTQPRYSNGWAGGDATLYSYYGEEYDEFIRLVDDREFLHECDASRRQAPPTVTSFLALLTSSSSSSLSSQATSSACSSSASVDRPCRRAIAAPRSSSEDPTTSKGNAVPSEDARGCGERLEPVQRWARFRGCRQAISGYESCPNSPLARRLLYPVAPARGVTRFNYNQFRSTPSKSLDADVAGSEPTAPDLTSTTSKSIAYQSRATVAYSKSNDSASSQRDLKEQVLVGARDIEKNLCVKPGLTAGHKWIPIGGRVAGPETLIHTDADRPSRGHSHDDYLQRQSTTAVGYGEPATDKPSDRCRSTAFELPADHSLGADQNLADACFAKSQDKHQQPQHQDHYQQRVGRLSRQLSECCYPRESDKSAESRQPDAMERQERSAKYYYEISSSTTTETSKSVNVSIGEHVTVNEATSQQLRHHHQQQQQRRVHELSVVGGQSLAVSGGTVGGPAGGAGRPGSMAETGQRVIVTQHEGPPPASGAPPSREGTPQRVPFERSVSAVATVKRADSDRSGSDRLAISQRDILVNRSRSWNAIEANLFSPAAGGNVGSLDHTILAEANGLIADMLMDPALPPSIVSGLRALQILLCPSQQQQQQQGGSQSGQKGGGLKAAVGQKVELAPLSEPGDIDDCEEIPFTGEKPSDMSKTRRQLPRSLLRRMSTSTWSTTTSATGMPTLEPEPSRKRSTGTRRGEDLSSGLPAADEPCRSVERLASDSSCETAPYLVDFICKYCGRRNSNTRKSSDPTVAKNSETRSFDAKEVGPGVYEINDVTLNTAEISADAHLATLCDWDFDIFKLTDQSPRTLLSSMCYRILSDTGLVDAFHIPEKELLCYLHALESGYRDVPYHNKMHAADVLHGVYYLTSQPVAGLEQTSISDLRIAQRYHAQAVEQLQADESALTYGVIACNLPSLELLALYIAAAMHDFEHPGRTNAFIVATHAPLAILYNDRSVLENHHAAAAWNLLLSQTEFNFLKNLEAAEFKRLRYVVIECILATDLKRHFEVLAEFTAKTNLEESPGINWNDEGDRLLVLEMAIKLSDINGPCKRRDLHVRWTDRICEEFYEQGDEELSLGLPVSPFMDRSKPQLPKLQESFINHLVAPLCNAYAIAGLLPGKWVVSAEDVANGGHPMASIDLNDGVRASADNRVECIQIKHLQENYAHWIKVIQDEKCREGQDTA